MGDRLLWITLTHPIKSSPVASIVKSAAGPVNKGHVHAADFLYNDCNKFCLGCERKSVGKCLNVAQGPEVHQVEVRLVRCSLGHGQNKNPNLRPDFEVPTWVKLTPSNFERIDL